MNVSRDGINFSGKLLKDGSEAFAAGAIYKGMIADVKHIDYNYITKKNQSGWVPIDEQNFTISITPKNIYSQILINAHLSIGVASDFNRLYGLRIYRKIGSGSWLNVDDQVPVSVNTNPKSIIK